MGQQAQVTVYVDGEGNVSSEVIQEDTEMSEEEVYKIAGEHIASKARGCVCGVLFKLFPDRSIQSAVLGAKTCEDFLKESPWLLELIRAHVERLLKGRNPNNEKKQEDIVDILHSSNGDGIAVDKHHGHGDEVLDARWP